MVVHPWQQVVTPVCLTQVDTVHIWRVNLQASADALKTAQAILAVDELERGQRLFRPELRQRYWLAHAWKRLILAQYLVGQQPKQLSFIEGQYGKPYLKLAAAHDLYFNMSHSADIALYAVTRSCEVGVDVEQINARINTMELAQRFFALSEYDQLRNLPLSEQPAGFYRMWSLKEAVIKALGKGLSYSLSSFEVALAPDFRHCLRYLAEAAKPDQWTLFSFPVTECFIAAVASPVQLKHCYCWDVVASVL